MGCCGLSMEKIERTVSNDEHARADIPRLSNVIPMDLTTISLRSHGQVSIVPFC